MCVCVCVCVSMCVCVCVRVCVCMCVHSRSASFSQSTRSSLFMGSDSAVQKLSHCLNGAGAHLQGFYSLPKPGKHHHLSTHHHHHHDPSAAGEACYAPPRTRHFLLIVGLVSGHPRSGGAPLGCNARLLSDFNVNVQ